MLFPRKGSEISLEWLQMVIESYERKRRPSARVKIQQFDVNKGTKAGENFNSELIRVEIKAKIDEESANDDVRYDLILKFHSLSIFSKETNRYSNNHIKELDIYDKIHKQLMNFQETELGGKYALNVPELIYGHNDGEDYVIAMRNLKSLGYALNDKKLGLNFEQLKLAVNQIARWHALSYAYNEKYKLLEEFPLLIEGLSRTAKFILYVLDFVIKSTYSLFTDKEEWKEFAMRLKNRKEILKKMKDHVLTNAIAKPGIWSLIHSDFWNNNLLFLYPDQECADNRTPVDVSILDWQMCHWNRSVIDLHYLLHSSTSYEIRKEYTEDILSEYFNVFHDITTALSVPIPGLTYESFKKDYKETSIVGFLYGICFAQGTLSKAGENVNLPTSSNVRGFSFKVQTKMARYLTPVIVNNFSFLAKAAVSRMFKPIREEVINRNNDIMITRLTGLIQEAIDNNILYDINPVTNRS